MFSYCPAQKQITKGEGMKTLSKLGIIIVAVLLLALPVVGACNSGDDNDGGDPVTPSSALPSSDRPEKKDVVITIGNLTDITGMASAQLSVVDMALADTVEYFNEENLIPGVELKVIQYDTMLNPARHIPGYEWLKEKGANLIYAGDPYAVESLKATVDRDGFVIFGSGAQDGLLEDPGYAFSASIHPANLIYPLLQWIAENDWDYLNDGPAKIGMAGFGGAFEFGLEDGLEAYCTAHPEQFEWAGAYLQMAAITWENEAEALKDCDYVVPPTVFLHMFLKEYANRDGKAKYIGTDNHFAFFET